MFKPPVALALLCCARLLAGEPGETVSYGRSFSSNPLPAFDKGYLLFLDLENGIEVWGPDGQLVFNIRITTPPAAHVMSAAVDSDGRVAVGIGYPRGSEGYGGGIVTLDRLGKQIRFVETGRYMPSHVCFDASNNLWTFGWQRDAMQNDREDTEDYSLFQKYSPEGKQLGASAPRSLFPRPGLPPGAPHGGLWALRASGDRVGAIASSGKTSAERQWIELGLDGSLIGHWKIGSYAHGGMAFTSSLGLCQERFDGIATPRVECFDREAQEWKPKSFSVTEENGRLRGILLGADGDGLVFGEGGGNIRLSWVK